MEELLFTSEDEENLDENIVKVKEDKDQENIEPQQVNQENQENQDLDELNFEDFDNQDYQENPDGDYLKNTEYQEGQTSQQQSEIIQGPEQECIALPYQRPPENVILYGTKLPSSLLLQPIPFDPDLYKVDTKPVIAYNEAGKPVVTKTIHDAVRWRYVTDDFGDTIRESNSRIVKWSNGTMSLFVGKEVYEMIPTDYVDYRDIYVRQRAEASSESFLQSHGVLTQKLTINPTNITKWRNDTMNFRKAVQSGVKQGSKVVAGHKLLDPEQDKKSKEKLEQWKIEMNSQYSAEKSKKNKPQEQFNEDFLEAGDEEDNGSQTTRRSYDPQKERESELRILAAKKGGKRPRFEASEEEAEEYDEGDLFGDDEEEETKSSKKKRS